jgi:hypothetical protein
MASESGMVAPGQVGTSSGISPDEPAAGEGGKEQQKIEEDDGCSGGDIEGK